jgi:hypothetical protein
MLALLGQHRGFVTNAFLNVTPLATSSDCTVGMNRNVSRRWSSVRTSTTFGRAYADADKASTPTMTRTATLTLGNDGNSLSPVTLLSSSAAMGTLAAQIRCRGRAVCARARDGRGRVYERRF